MHTVLMWFAFVSVNISRTVCTLYWCDLLLFQLIYPVQYAHCIDVSCFVLVIIWHTICMLHCCDKLGFSYYIPNNMHTVLLWIALFWLSYPTQYTIIYILYLLCFSDHIPYNMPTVLLWFDLFQLLYPEQYADCIVFYLVVIKVLCHKVIHEINLPTVLRIA